jgi:hypothetical protein
MKKTAPSGRLLIAMMNARIAEDACFEALSQKVCYNKQEIRDLLFDIDDTITQLDVESLVVATQKMWHLKAWIDAYNDSAIWELEEE